MSSHFSLIAACACYMPRITRPCVTIDLTYSSDQVPEFGIFDSRFWVYEELPLPTLGRDLVQYCGNRHFLYGIRIHVALFFF